MTDTVEHSPAGCGPEPHPFNQEVRHLAINRAAEAYREWSRAHPYMATTVETVALFGARTAVEAVAKKCDMPVGNAFQEDNLELAARHPIQAGILACIWAPVSEELLYRGIAGVPASRAQTQGQETKARLLDATVTAAFAAGHAGLVRPERPLKPPFVRITTEDITLPLPQLLGGLHYQRLKNTRGIKHAILAHVITNGLYGISAIAALRRARHR